MKKIELYAGIRIDKAFEKMQKENPCWTEFNGKVITSEETIDQLYVKITGVTKAESDKRQKECFDETKRKDEEHKANIPKLTEEYIQKGKELLAEEYHELWEKVVPIRLDDLYKGFELQATLDIISVLNKSENLDDVFVEAKEVIVNQGHSGMSWSLMMSMLSSFHKNGKEFVNRLKQEV